MAGCVAAGDDCPRERRLLDKDALDLPQRTSDRVTRAGVLIEFSPDVGGRAERVIEDHAPPGFQPVQSPFGGVGDRRALSRRQFARVQLEPVETIGHRMTYL